MVLKNYILNLDDIKDLINNIFEKKKNWNF